MSTEPLNAVDLLVYLSNPKGASNNIEKVAQDILIKGIDFTKPDSSTGCSIFDAHDMGIARFAKELAHRALKPGDFKQEGITVSSDTLREALRKVSIAIYTMSTCSRKIKVLSHLNESIAAHPDKKDQLALRHELYQADFPDYVVIHVAPNGVRIGPKIDFSALKHSEAPKRETAGKALVQSV